MGVEHDQLELLREQIRHGFLIGEYDFGENVHHFVLPALEYDCYMISIPDGPEVRAFLDSSEYHNATMVPGKSAWPCWIWWASRKTPTKFN